MTCSDDHHVDLHTRAIRAELKLRQLSRQLVRVINERDALLAEFDALKTPIPAAMHLPAQSAELRARALELIGKAQALLRLIPVEHDDAQGGRPVEDHSS